MDEYANEELEEAYDALSDVTELRKVDVTEKLIVNRLYYACFHAARAALHTRGFDPNTHKVLSPYSAGRSSRRATHPGTMVGF
ncbi:MAG: hypothetical protein IH933_03410 [Euryarchaeota archaeon]|jgi:uncharacterized protein (UPF0332 family)|nr:hypothetical protein [Euryarchaeota archaeon]